MSFSEASNRELNEQLQPRVAAGDEAARKQMIESNMRFVAYKVEQFLATHPQYAYLKDDLISEGYIGLTEAVDEIRTKPGDNPTGLIATCITRSIRRAAENDSLVRVPERSRVRSGITVPGRGEGDKLVDDPTKEIDLRDAVAVTCTETERQLVACREAGFTDAEIAETLGIPRSTVTTTRKEIAKRLKNLS